MKGRDIMKPRVLVVALTAIIFLGGGVYHAGAADAPRPLFAKDHPVDWRFVFKFNSASFPGCGGETRACSFGGQVQSYRSSFGQQFVYACSEDRALQKGSGCAGETPKDPLGATFRQIYTQAFYYVIWNDQFYRDPRINACSGDR